MSKGQFRGVDGKILQSLIFYKCSVLNFLNIVLKVFYQLFSFELHILAHLISYIATVFYRTLIEVLSRLLIIFGLLLI